MTIFDFIVIGIVGFSGLLGLMRGFIKEVLSLLAYILGVMGALRWGPLLVPEVSGFIDNALLSMVLSYLAVFFLVLICVGLVNKTLSAVLNFTGLGPADRGLGFLFGLCRGALIVVIVAIVASYTRFPQEPWWQQAQLSPLVSQAVEAMKFYLPQDIAAYLPQQGANNRLFDGAVPLPQNDEVAPLSLDKEVHFNP